VAAVLAALAAASAAGVRADTLALAGWAVALHLWFLPVYLLLTLLTPALYAAHRRWGLAVPAAMVLVGAGIDIMVVTLHTRGLGWLNYILVWGAAYQLGFAWQDGTLTRRRRDPMLLAAGGAAVFIALEAAGLFPVSLIGVEGSRINNTAPPSVALMAYAAAQLGTLVALAPAARSWLRRPRVWRVVETCNADVMTVYLWHMLPVVLAGALLYPTRLMSQPAVGSATWWVLRPVWMVTVAILMAPVVILSRRLRGPRRESAGSVAGPAVRGHLFLLGAAAGLTGFALARFAIAGFAPDGRLPIVAVGIYTVGFLLAMVDSLPVGRHGNLATPGHGSARRRGDQRPGPGALRSIRDAARTPRPSPRGVLGGRRHRRVRGCAGGRGSARPAAVWTARRRPTAISRLLPVTVGMRLSRSILTPRGCAPTAHALAR
jgi:hypothetical protein